MRLYSLSGLRGDDAKHFRLDIYSSFTWVFPPRVATKLGFTHFAKLDENFSQFHEISRNSFWQNFVLNHFVKFCDTSEKEQIFKIKKLDDIVPFITTSSC